MKVYKKTSVQGEFAKKGEDIKNGDVIEFANAGEVIEGKFGTQTVFKFKLTDGSVKNVNVNQTSINYLVDLYGDDTDSWVGKETKAFINTENVSGGFVKVLYLTSPDVNDLDELQGVRQEVDPIDEANRINDAAAEKDRNEKEGR
jgi:hypothetical protein|tara:strand:+ start:62 stop:496 length:435 start_codon:yes stop_codon:yes gene_type:complete